MRRQIQALTLTAYFFLLLRSMPGSYISFLLLNARSVDERWKAFKIKEGNENNMIFNRQYEKER